MSSPRESRRRVRLADAVLEQVQAHALSDAQVDELMALQRDVLEGPERPTWRRRAALLAASAALLLAVLAWWPGALVEQPDSGTAIAHEVVENHLKLKPLDIQTGSMKELQAYFTQLDFRPAIPTLPSTGPDPARNALLGGRYCSVKGVTAAQLRYSDAGGLSTLYEVPYDPAVFGPVPRLDAGESPRQIDARGLLVSLWVEKGLLMVLVEEH